MNSTIKIEQLLGTAPVHGRGRIQIPKKVRVQLNIKDKDEVFFVKDDSGNILIQKVPVKEEKHVGRYR